MLRIGRLSLITLIILVAACATQVAEVTRVVEEPQAVVVPVEVTREVPITVEVVSEIEGTVEAAVQQTVEAWPTHTPIPSPTSKLSSEPELSRLGDEVEEDGCSLSAISVADPGRPNKMFYTPTDGMRLIGVEIVVGSTGAEAVSVNPYSVTLVDAEGFSHEVEWDALKKRDQIAARDIGPGERVKGWVAFEVNEGIAPEYVKYEFMMLDDVVVLTAGLEQGAETVALESTEVSSPTDTPEPTSTPTPVPTDTPEPTSTPTPVPTDTPEPTSTPTPVPTDTPEPDEETIDTFRKSANSDITYKMVEKSDKYLGESVCWRGKIFNIEESEGETYFQAWYFTGKRYNALKHSDAFMVYFEGELPKIFNEDSVEVCGYIGDKISGTNAFGGTVTQPSIYAEFVRKMKKR